MNNSDCSSSGNINSKAQPQDDINFTKLFKKLNGSFSNEAFEKLQDELKCVHN